MSRSFSDELTNDKFKFVAVKTCFAGKGYLVVFFLDFTVYYYKTVKMVFQAEFPAHTSICPGKIKRIRVVCAPNYASGTVKENAKVWTQATLKTQKTKHREL